MLNRISACALLSLLLCLPPAAYPADLTLNNTPARVCFSPGGGCTRYIVHEIEAARTEVLVQAFSFTSREIAKALADARKRGLRVEVILDRSNRTERYSSLDFLAHAGIRTYIDDAHEIAHNKVMVIDRLTVITGSFNFTFAAETNNAENLLMIKNAGLARLYADNWTKHRDHSDSYRGR